MSLLWFELLLFCLQLTMVDAWSLERRDAPVAKPTPISFPYVQYSLLTTDATLKDKQNLTTMGERRGNMVR
jgi:hypothetical protein